MTGTRAPHHRGAGARGARYPGPARPWQSVRPQEWAAGDPFRQPRQHPPPATGLTAARPEPAVQAGTGGSGSRPVWPSRGLRVVPFPVARTSQARPARPGIPLRSPRA